MGTWNMRIDDVDLMQSTNAPLDDQGAACFYEVPHVGSQDVRLRASNGTPKESLKGVNKNDVALCQHFFFVNTCTKVKVLRATRGSFFLQVVTGLKMLGFNEFRKISH